MVADFVGYLGDQHSTNSYCIYVGGNIIIKGRDKKFESFCSSLVLN